MSHAMYLIVNNNLGMGKGKIAAQVAHGACHVTRILHGQGNTAYNNWLFQGEAKIVLKATQEELEQIFEKYQNRNNNFWCVSVHDAGHTQIPVGSLTVLAFCPIQKSKVPADISAMKLL